MNNTDPSRPRMTRVFHVFLGAKALVPNPEGLRQGKYCVPTPHQVDTGCGSHENRARREIAARITRRLLRPSPWGGESPQKRSSGTWNRDAADHASSTIARRYPRLAERGSRIRRLCTSVPIQRSPTTCSFKRRRANHGEQLFDPKEKGERVVQWHL